MPETPYIRLENVGKVYDTRNGTVEACADVSLDIREHEFVAFVGPSGCGKTTIMKMVAGLQSHTSGTITVGGRKVDRPQTDVGIVFQEAILLDWRDVLANVMLQVDIRKLDRAKFEPVARHLIEATGLKGFEHKKPYELSGGEQQRVAIARALKNDPSSLFCDEPTGNLDKARGWEIAEFLRDLFVKEKKTVLIVTHDERIAKMADKVLTLGTNAWSTEQEGGK